MTLGSRPPELTTTLTRYGAFERAVGEVVIYDPQNAGILSSVTWSSDDTTLCPVGPLIAPETTLTT